MVAVGLFFLGMSAYKLLTRSSDTASRVAERPGPKASVEEPSPTTLRELIQRQSAAGAASKLESKRDDRSPLPLVEPATSDVQLPALDLSSQGRISAAQLPPAARGTELDGKLAEASYMTAKTEVYIQAATADSGRVGESSRPPEPDTAAVIRQVRAGSNSLPSSAEALSRVLDSRELSKLMPGGKPNTEERLAARTREQEAFANAPTRSTREPLDATAAPAQFIVSEGMTIPAVLVRAIGSQLPGQVEARVTSDVYDSLGRGRVLIPKGSRITGTYNAYVGVGQERLQAVFTRLIFPSGASITLESSAAADRSGHSGIPGEVDHHYFRMLGSALAVGMLTYAVERRAARDVTAQANGAAVNVYGGAATAPGTVAAQTFANVTNQVLERHLSVGPTITVPAGTRIHVEVARDLAIDPGKVL
jgi:type IV secretion system protein VirB10